MASVSAWSQGNTPVESAPKAVSDTLWVGTKAALEPGCDQSVRRSAGITWALTIRGANAAKASANRPTVLVPLYMMTEDRQYASPKSAYGNRHR